jgi:beta-1,4-N-acetylglucosaminyltransferase
MAATTDPSEQFCLVTVGATVGFKSLVQEVIHPEFWNFLRSKGFTHLRIQCGPDIPWAAMRLASFQHESPKGLEVQVFETSKNLMKEEMTLCQSKPGARRQGIIISHAGMSRKFG